MATFDPKTVPIQGDLSRADVVELVRMCRGKRVVEFGMGGSTLILMRCARSLDSYETDPHWHCLTAHRMKQVKDKTCEPTLMLSPDTPSDIPECDIIFVDGLSSKRDEWMRLWRRTREAVVLHDSRVPATWRSVMELLRDEESGTWVEGIDFHVNQSNLLVVRKRPEPVAYENWNITEASDTRIPASQHNFYGTMPPFPAAWLEMDPKKSPRLAAYREDFLTAKEASAAMRAALTSGLPASVVVLGDGEAAWWAYDELKGVPGIGGEWLRNLAVTSGFDLAEDRETLLAGFDEAIRNSALMPIQYNWTQAEMLCLEALERKGTGVPRRRIDCNAVYRMNEWGDFFPVLEGRRVLVVGGYAARQASAMGSVDFQRGHARFGCVGGYRVVGHVQTPSKRQQPKARWLPGVLEAISAVEFDIALVSAGGLAFHICEHVRRTGRVAFDCGSLDRMILGDRGKPYSTFLVPESSVSIGDGGSDR
jgi:hypothetical protein